MLVAAQQAVADRPPFRFATLRLLNGKTVGQASPVFSARSLIVKIKVMKEIQIGGDSDLEKLVKAIAEDMVTACTHWRLFSSLMDSIPEYEMEFNQARCFWSLTLRAHKISTLSVLGRLYDPTVGALSLPNFLMTIRKNMDKFGEEAFRERLKDNPHIEGMNCGSRRPTKAQLQKDLCRVTASNDSLVKDLLDYRNGHIGHRDSKEVLGVLKLPDLSARQIMVLLGRAREIINRYQYLYRAGVHSTQMVGEGDFASVLDSVRKSLADYEAGIAKEIEEAEARVKLK